MRPEYNQKLLDVHLLAPVYELKNTRNKMYTVLAKFYTPLKRILEIFRLYKITLAPKVLSLLSKIVSILCKNDDKPTIPCKLTIDAILGSSHINAVSDIKSNLFSIKPCSRRNSFFSVIYFQNNRQYFQI